MQAVMDVVTLLDLPSDIWNSVFPNLVAHDALMLQATNKRLFRLCDKQFGWISPNDETMRHFARLGATSCLKYLNDIGIEWEEDTIAQAATTGRLETIKFLHENGCEKSSSACREAVNYGQLDCLKFLHENGYDWDGGAFDAAVYAYIKYGNFEILKYLRENGCTWRPTLIMAAASANIDVLKYVLTFVENDVLEEYKYCLCSFAASRANNLEALKFLHESGCPINRCCQEAAFNGNLESLKYAHEHGDQWGRTISKAIEGWNFVHESSPGHIECIKYALLNGDTTLVDEPDDDLQIMSNAVRTGNIEIVKLLVQHGGKWKGDEYEAAVYESNLDMVKYLLEVEHRPKPSTKVPCVWATQNLAILKYLHENGFSWDGTVVEPWDRDDKEEVRPLYNIVYCAVEHQNLPCLKYILKCGYQLDTNDMSLCNSAARKNNVEMLEYLTSLGCQKHDSIMEVAAKSGSLKVLKYLHKSGRELSESVAKSAALHGQVRVLEYLFKRGYGLTSDVCSLAASTGQLKCLRLARKYGVPFTVDTMRNACERPSFECMTYLHENGCEWSNIECTVATKENYLDQLKYLHEHGSQWNEETWYTAVDIDSVKCLEYLFANGCPQDPRTYDMTNREECYAFMQQHNIIPNKRS